MCSSELSIYTSLTFFVCLPCKWNSCEVLPLLKDIYMLYGRSIYKNGSYLITTKQDRCEVLLLFKKNVQIKTTYWHKYVKFSFSKAGQLWQFFCFNMTINKLVWAFNIYKGAELSIFTLQLIVAEERLWRSSTDLGI